MNIITEIESLVGQCRSVEKELIKLRKAKDQLAAKGADAESRASGSATSPSAIDALAAELAKNRRALEDLAAAISLHEKALIYHHALLRNRAVETLGRTRDRFNLFSAAVKAELQNRLNPFLSPLSYRRAIPETDLLPLQASRASLLGMEGRLMQLKDDPVTVAEFYCEKYQRLLKEIAAAEHALGIQPDPKSPAEA